MLPVRDHLVIFQAEDPDRVAAEDVVLDQLRRFLAFEVEPDRELAGVFDVRLAQDLKRQQPLIGLAAFVDKLHAANVERGGQRRGASRQADKDDSSDCRASSQLGMNAGVAASPSPRCATQRCLRPGRRRASQRRHAGFVRVLAIRALMLAILTSCG